MTFLRDMGVLALLLVFFLGYADAKGKKDKEEEKRQVSMQESAPFVAPSTISVTERCVVPARLSALETPSDSVIAKSLQKTGKRRPAASASRRQVKQPQRPAAAKKGKKQQQPAKRGRRQQQQDSYEDEEYEPDVDGFRGMADTLDEDTYDRQDHFIPTVASRRIVAPPAPPAESFRYFPERSVATRKGQQSMMAVASKAARARAAPVKKQPGKKSTRNLPAPPPAPPTSSRKWAGAASKAVPTQKPAVLTASQRLRGVKQQQKQVSRRTAPSKVNLALIRAAEQGSRRGIMELPVREDSMVTEEEDDDEDSLLARLRSPAPAPGSRKGAGRLESEPMSSSFEQVFLQKKVPKKKQPVKKKPAKPVKGRKGGKKPAKRPVREPTSSSELPSESSEVSSSVIESSSEEAPRRRGGKDRRGGRKGGKKPARQTRGKDRRKTKAPAKGKGRRGRKVSVSESYISFSEEEVSSSSEEYVARRRGGQKKPKKTAKGRGAGKKRRGATSSKKAKSSRRQKYDETTEDSESISSSSDYDRRRRRRR